MEHRQLKTLLKANRGRFSSPLPLMECLATEILVFILQFCIANKTQIQKNNYVEVFFYDEDFEKQNDDGRLEGKERTGEQIR